MKTILLFLVAFPVFAQTTVEQAYKKELVFLHSQKSELRERLGNLQKQEETKIAKAKRELAIMQAKLVGLNASNEGLTQEVGEWERNAESADESKGLYDTTIGQATYTLKSRLKVEELKEKSLDDYFTTGLKELEHSSASRKVENKKFFLLDGKAVNGKMILIGDVAKFGEYQGKWFLLSPVGGGDFKAQTEMDKKTMDELLAGKVVNNIPLWLFESADLAQEKKESQSLVDYITSGGLIAWVIVVIGLFATLLTILRAVLLKRSSSSTHIVGDSIQHLVEAGKIQDALDSAAQSKTAVGRVMYSTLRHIDRDRAELEDIIAENIIHESKPLDRFGTMIMMFASVAPLFGLLGTVTGMIDTFDIITEFGQGDPKMLSSGISVALITTEFGLIVAIPALMVGNMLTGWSDGIKLEMEKTALKVTNAFMKFKHDKGVK